MLFSYEMTLHFTLYFLLKHNSRNVTVKIDTVFRSAEHHSNNCSDAANVALTCLKCLCFFDVCRE